MLQFLKGDILFTKAQTIGHGVSIDDDFKTGLGLTLRQAYPELYKEFRQFVKNGNPKPGQYWQWKHASKNILQLFIREENSKAKASHLNRALHEVRRHYQELGITSLALTRLGSGTGKLDWAEAKETIQAQFGDLVKLPVTVYEDYAPGKRAE
jgi:O-acetyl-ADP-ribose deacetylase (regulator of RNase III)